MTTKPPTKLSARRLKGGGAATMDLMANDKRSERAATLIRADDAGRAIVADLFADQPLDEAKTATLLQTRAVVAEEWGKAQNAALKVGQALLHLSQTLSADEFRRVRRGSERLFPFSDAMATKLRLAALTMADWRLSVDEAPPYTVLYEISTLPPEGWDIVRERGLMRPDVRRGEIVAVRRELKQHKITGPVVIEGHAEPGEGTPTVSRADLLRERERLVSALANIDAQIALMDAAARG
ncbi:hypothetical protein EAH89_28845 [Roseomonas nepalensis]|uniref:DUF3102 domain-containing protein n=1 Tax=Muricoccus nepalensis TaxID=1854500 RepID=A0A502ET27_9PROT|nr:hypothetical protein [Roseomonas nepalensis]TPG40973.1 hypothetical protein EAH89_28845 [Roseomonas nepalensis]